MGRTVSSEQLALYRDRIKDMIVKSGRSLESIATEVGVSKQTLSKMINTNKSINMGITREIANVLGCTLEYLVGTSDNPFTTGVVADFSENIGVIIPIEFDHTAPRVKQRIFDLCGNDEIMLLLIADCLEKSSAKDKVFLKSILKGYLNTVSSNKHLWRKYIGDK